MKVLFLDVDGVLNTNKAHTILSLSKGCMRRLQSIFEATDCKIVLSSTWRKFEDEPMRKLRYRLLQRGMVLYGKTPIFNSGCRGEEIRAWMDEYQAIDKYAIVDDDSDMLVEQLPHFFQTDPDYGLTSTIAYRIIHHLGEK